MCGRYAILEEEAIIEMREIINQVNEKFNDRSGLTLRGEIRPANLVPVLKSQGDQVALDVMKWGFPRWDSSSGLIINARSESVLVKPLFRSSFLDRRIIVPSSGFYEWDHYKTSQRDKYFFSLKDRVTYMAGFYNTFKQADGQEANCFVILTMPAAGVVAKVHDRMPVILPKQSIRTWLSPEIDAAKLFNVALPPLVSAKCDA